MRVYQHGLCKLAPLNLSFLKFVHVTCILPSKKVPLTNIFKSTSFAKILIEKMHFEVLFGIKHVLKFSIYGLALAF